jgi:hypothetical protein
VNGVDTAPHTDATKGTHTSPSSNATKGAHTSSSSNASPSSDASPDGHSKHGANWLSSLHACSSQDGICEQHLGGWYPRYGEREPKQSAVESRIQALRFISNFIIPYRCPKALAY